jgi:hypothetical protein
MYGNVSFAYQKDEWRGEAPPLIFCVAIFASQKFSSL